MSVSDLVDLSQNMKKGIVYKNSNAKSELWKNHMTEMNKWIIEKHLMQETNEWVKINESYGKSHTNNLKKHALHVKNNMFSV